MKSPYLAAMGLLLTYNASAELGEEGFEFIVGAQTSYQSSMSNFNTDNSVITGKLNQKGKSESGISFMPYASLSYTFGETNNHQFTLDMDSIGYTYEVEPDSMLSLSLTPSLKKDETWLDPYVVGSQRQTTEMSTQSALLSYENFNQQGTSVSVSYFSLDVEKEQSGKNYQGAAPALKRDGKGYNLGLSQMWSMNEEAQINTGVSYEAFSADGKAMSYKKYGLEIGYTLAFDNHTVNLNGDYFYQPFDAINPVFNKKQSNNGYSLAISYEYQDIFDWQDWNFESMASYQATTSNIVFYETNELTIGTALSYRF